MQKIIQKYHPMAKQIGYFLIHLRWHYQVFILSGGFWLGGYLFGVADWPEFILQFANVHLLLFGGASAFNSYWDEDTGPIGGVKHPPTMHRWMRDASLILQLIGLVLAMAAGWLFTLIYAMSMLFFWLYSTPKFRWKSTPLRSLVAIGISTGTNSVLLGFLAAGGELTNIAIWLAALGCSFMILSLYPVSQLYQTEEDRTRGDKTFAVKYGINGVIIFFRTAYAIGLVLVGFAIGWEQWPMGGGFVIVGTVSGLWINQKLLMLKTHQPNYDLVMRLKYSCSMSFLGLILFLMIYDSMF